MAIPIDALKAGLADYFKSEEHSDCTIICGPYHFKVHKLVIGAHSEYFRTALKADTFNEGKTGTIELKAKDPNSDDPEDACDDPEIVKLMVGYFYYLNYFKEDNEVHLIEHAKVFAMAVKYHIAALQNLAAQKFQAEVIEHWNHEDLGHAIHVIYTSTAEDVTQLREVAVKVLNAHRDQLLLKPDITTLLRSITGLACDLLLRDSSSITGRHLAEDRPLLCCNFNPQHSNMACRSCGCDLHPCESCTRFQLQLNCPACGEEL